MYVVCSGVYCGTYRSYESISLYLWVSGISPKMSLTSAGDMALALLYD